MKIRFIAKLILFSVLLVAVDQLSKYLIRSSGGFYICNKNIAFGIEISALPFWTFWLSIVIVLTILVFRQKYIIPACNALHSNAGRHNTLYTILIISGALSNIIDRLFYGCVIDFIDLKFWPVFNLADVFITSGAILLLAKYLKLYYNNKQNSSEKVK